jgi:hypothetical protein
MEYSLPYIFVLLVLGICALAYETFKDEEPKAYTNLFAIFVFFIFFGFRGYVFTDWTSYADTIRDVEWGDIFQLTTAKSNSIVHEPGFTLLCCICSLFSRQLPLLVVVTTIIDILLFVRFFKRWNINNMAFVWILFIAFEGLNIMFNLLRNQIAILLFLNALEYIGKRKPLQYFSLCTLALCFHLSSLLFFPLYFFLHRRLNRWAFLAIYICLLVVFITKVSTTSMLISIFGLEDTLAAKAKVYMEQYTTSRELSISGTIIALFLIGLLMIYYNKITKEFQYRIMAVNSMLIYFFFFYVFAEFKELSFRMSLPFIFPFWFLWFDIGKCLTIKGNRIILYSFVYFFALYTTTFNMKIAVQQYDNLLFGAKSQQERLRILNKTYEPDN